MVKWGGTWAAGITIAGGGCVSSVGREGEGGLR